MSNFIKFTPLLGSRSGGSGSCDGSGGGPLCYLLEIDEAKLLLDCGWSDGFDVEELQLLKRFAKQVDAVLLSHGDLYHVGALPYAMTSCGLVCPVYATIPVHNMGSVALIEALHAKTHSQDFKLFNMHSIDAAFDKIHQLRFLQPVALGGRAAGITITAHAAGHTVGGTVWKIKKDTEDIVYAVDYNHKKERHLNGTILHLGNEVLGRPSVLITDCYNFHVTQPGRKHADKLLFETIYNALTLTASTVIIPIESSTRILELACLLDQFWGSRNIPFPLLFLADQSVKTFNYAKSMLEWMGDSIASTFSQRKENPFDFNYLRCIQKLEEVSKFSKEKPRVILVSTPSLDGGFSQALLRQLGADPNVLLILPERGGISGGVGSGGIHTALSRQLFDEWDARARSGGESGGFLGDAGLRGEIQLNMNIPYTLKEKIPLEGEELKEYLRLAKQKKDQEEAERTKKLEDDDSESEMEDGDEEERDLEGRKSSKREEGGEPNSLTTTTTLAPSTAAPSGFNSLLHSQFDIFVKDQTRTGGFFKQSQAFKMFPVFEYRMRGDDYGEYIDPSVYMKGEYQFAMAQQAANEAAASAAEDARGGGALAKKKQMVEIPCKYTATPATLELRCRLLYIDFEGRIDGKSYKSILRQVAPKKMILIHGSEQATQDLRDFCLSAESITNDIFCPVLGECIDVSSAKNIYQVKLTDSLLTSLHFNKIGDYEISFLSGVIEQPPMEDIVAVAADQALQVITQASSSTDSTVSPDSTEKSAVTAAATISSESNKDADAMQVDGDESATKIPVDENKDPETSTSSNAAVVPSVMGNNKPTIIPTIDLVPNTYRRAHKSVIIGNPKLSEFRKILQDKGFNTRFAAGKLLVNGKVVVRKDTKSTTTATSAGGGAGGGSLVIEGVLGSVYYDVRRLLYSQLTVL